MREPVSLRRILLALALTTALAPLAHAGNFRLLPDAQTPAVTPPAPPVATPEAAAPLPAPLAPAIAPAPVAVTAAPVVPAAAPSLTVPSLATPAAASLPVAATPAPAVRLMPFEQSQDRLELTGEDETRVLTFYASAEQAAAGGALQLAYQNAVSVLPDTGTIDVTLNGQPAGSFAIRSPNGVKLESLSVAAGALKVGRNRVTLHARQRHRVDCSMDATYELWTRLDPVRSGFLSAAPMRFAALEELMGVGRSAEGNTDIRLVIRKGADAVALGENAGVIQALALYLNRDDVVVSVDETGGKGPGIDLYVGAPDQTQTPEGRQLLSQAPAGLSLRPGAVAGRVSVLLQGTNATERNAFLLAALRGPMRLGLESGIMSAQWGEIAGDAGKSFTLREAGYVTAPFSGRLARTDFDLRMPADFYPADYDTVDFHLHAATAPGLARDAKMLMRVNGEVVSSLPFRNAAGEQFDRKRVKLPLRAFRPGINRVEIVAELPNAADLTCAPQMAAQEKPRFLLLDDSTFKIPALARLSRLPDLAALAGSAYPFSDGKPFDIFLDSQEPGALAGAMTTLVHLSLAARKPLDAAIRFGAPVEEEGRNALVIATRATPALAQVPSAAPDATTGDPFSGTDRDTPSGKDGITTSALADAPVQAAANTSSLLEAFQENTAADAQQSSWLERTEARVLSLVSRFRNWLNYETPSRADGDAETGALVTVSQGLSPGGAATWTTLRAASAGELEQGVAMLTRPGVWSAMQGGRAAIQGSDGTLVSRPADHRVITGISDPSIGNLRRLAAAWFSDNFQIYVVLVLLLMGSFGAWLGFFVPKKGIRTDE